MAKPSLRDEVRHTVGYSLESIINCFRFGKVAGAHWLERSSWTLLPVYTCAHLATSAEEKYTPDCLPAAKPERPAGTRMNTVKGNSYSSVIISNYQQNRQNIPAQTREESGHAFMPRITGVHHVVLNQVRIFLPLTEFLIFLFFLLEYFCYQ